MASGYPDYLSWSGRAAGGEEVKRRFDEVYAAAEDEHIYTFDAVPAGKEYIYQAVAASTMLDTHFHTIQLWRVSEFAPFFAKHFVTEASFDFPGVVIKAGDALKVIIFNSSDDTNTYYITVFWTERAI